MVQMDKLLQTTINYDASDIHLTVGRPPTIRVKGSLKSLNTAPLNPEDTEALMKSISSERAQQELDQVGSSDFAFAFEDKARFRVSIYKQKGHHAICMRMIPNQILSFEEIGLPPTMKNLLLKPRGLILVTGPTGSGKTTTLATMIDFINGEADHHIITVEEPIEYYFTHKRSVVTQREIGVDVPGFAEALRRALRQDPDVIMVGEMRDLDTIGAALSAAETGHLVFGTLHTTGASRTINRIIDVFPVEQQEQIRTQLSVSVVAVISQQLLPLADGKGRIAAFEIMVMNPAIENLIRENKTFRIDSAIQTGAKQGMILLDDYLYSLFNKGKITFETMMRASQRPDDLQQKIKEAAAAQKKKRR